MDIRDVSSSLQPSPDGIWHAARQEPISYPDDGHAACLQIEDRSFWFRHRNDCIAAMVRRNPPPPGMLLDIGGGNGFVAQRLQAEGRDVVLLEPSPVGAANAKARLGPAHVACATLEEARFKPESFAAFGMFDVIEHIEDESGFLRTATRLLPAGGMAYFTVPCHPWLWSHADVLSGHYRRHTLATLRTLLADEYEIAYMSHYFGPLLLPQWLLRALPHRLGFRRRKGVLGAESEHGTSGGAATRALSRLLASEVDNVLAGRAMRFGASALVAARKR